MKTRILVLLSCISLFGGSAAVAAEPVGKALLGGPVICPLPPSLTIGEAQNGKDIDAYVGQNLVLALPSNPTTGFDWHVIDYAPSILEQTDVSFKPAGTQGLTLEGSGGTKVYTFRATEPGESVLALVYKRTWEAGTPAQTFSVKVLVSMPPQPPTHGNFSASASAVRSRAFRGVVKVKIWKETGNGEDEETTAGPEWVTEFTQKTFARFSDAVFAAHDMAPNVEARALKAAAAKWAGIPGTLRSEPKWDFVEIHEDQ